MHIITANTPNEYEAAKQLFIAYQQFLGADLCFQSFDEELLQLPQMYGPPHGALLLAIEENNYTGCIALRKKKEGVCEMKRLYVTDNHRGKGLGRKLSEAIILKAKELGYNKMILDTLNRLAPALSLYSSLGFTETTAYYDNPLEGVVYMEKNI